MIATAPSSGDTGWPGQTPPPAAALWVYSSQCGSTPSSGPCHLFSGGASLPWTAGGSRAASTTSRAAPATSPTSSPSSSSALQFRYQRLARSLRLTSLQVSNTKGLFVNNNRD